MDVDSHPAPANSAESTLAPPKSDGTAGSVTGATTPSGRKSAAPVDAVTQDLLPECIVYIRLLLILSNLDAGNVKEVGDSGHLTSASTYNTGWRVCSGDHGDYFPGKQADNGSIGRQGIFLPRSIV